MAVDVHERTGFRTGKRSVHAGVIWANGQRIFGAADGHDEFRDRGPFSFLSVSHRLFRRSSNGSRSLHELVDHTCVNIFIFMYREATGRKQNTDLLKFP